jgi:hypothetical protein
MLQRARMLAGRRVCLLLVLALLVPALSGCSNSEPTVASAIAHSGVLGSVGEQLKREDDEAEAQEIREQAAQTPEERREQRERAESSAIEANPAGEPQGGEAG